MQSFQLLMKIHCCRKYSAAFLILPSTVFPLYDVLSMSADFCSLKNLNQSFHVSVSLSVLAGLLLVEFVEITLVSKKSILYELVSKADM
nr:MAG TPA_asm: hypothetical protein [Caudoviricetes sp.]